MKKRRKKNNYFLSKQIVGLTVFLDALFLVALISIGILVFSAILHNQKEYNVVEENQMISQSIDQVLNSKINQLDALADAQATIDYLTLVNQGETPIQNVGDTNYNIYLNSQNVLNQVIDSESIFVQSFIVSEEEAGGVKVTNDGQLLTSDQGFVLSETPWYDDLEIDHFTLTNPYENISGEYQMTMVEKVVFEGNLLGYVGINININLLGEIVTELVTSDSSDLILLSHSKSVIFMTLEHQEEYLGKTPEEYGDIDSQLGLEGTGLSKLLENIESNGVVSEDVFAKNYLIHYNEIEDSNWTVILLKNDTLLFPIEYILIISVVVVCFLIFLMYILLNNSINKSLRPIQDVLATIREIKNGNYQYKLDVKVNNEIKEIADAINMMSEEIDRRVDLMHQNMNYNDITGLKTQAAISEDINNNVLIEEKKVAICLLQIENIKDIVVIMGQQMVNSIMRYMADVIEHMTGKEDILFSNTEFELAYVINNFDKLSTVETKINKIIDHFSKPINVEGKKLDVKVFAGVATYPNDGDTLDSLIKKCEIAIYKDKHSTKKQMRFYNDKISQEISYQAKVLDQLSLALERNEIYLKYQPLVDKKSEVYGFESLARWSSEMLGEISPEIFIDNAERNYLIVPIGTWILREACKAQVAFREKFNKEFVMSVNVSLIQIMQSNYVEVVKKIIRETDINPKYLTLELTESIFINSTITLDDKIAELHKIGVRFSLDDFGTGYASLTYLRQIAFDNLKIDKSFIDGVLETSKEHHIVSMVISLVHHLNMKVIVEGVESLKQFEYLKQISTDVFQGYFISKPLLYNETVKFIVNFYDTPKAKRIDMLNKNNT